ncbi:MAG: hypothetical protein IJW98_02545 [Clostridia bacterium]|nr:hypothetical protein [Clostridia bacterium]
MKKLLATVLAAATVLCMAPAFAVSAEEPTLVDGLTQTSYHMAAKTSAWGDAFKWLMGKEKDEYYTGNNGMKRFDTTLPDLMYWSYKTNAESASVTDFQVSGDGLARDTLKAPNGDNYMLNWKGTMTASKDVTFTLVANKIDNGFVFEMDGTRYYEWWGSSHYFDKAEERVVSDLGEITLKAGESHDVEIWFLELTGGDALAVGAYEKDTTDYKSLGDLGITLDLKVDCYHADVDRWGSSDHGEHPYVNAFRNNCANLKGTGANGQFQGGNGAQCIEDNFNFDETFDALVAASKQIGGDVITPIIGTWTPAVNDESYMNVYNGFVTVPETGYYLFGCAQVDNGFYMEIDGTTVFELWANGTWQDNEVDSWYTAPIKLEAGKTYPLFAAFLEMDGGNVLEPIVKFSATEDFSAAEAKNMNDVLTYKTTVPTNTDMLNPAVAAPVVADGTDLTDKVKMDTVNCTIGQWGDGAVANIFDNNLSTKLGASVGGNFGATITWQTTEATTVTHYSIVTSEDGVAWRRIPTGWALSGSNDGVNYEVIDYVTRGMTGLGCSSNQVATFEVDEPAAYTYYKLVINTCWWGGDAVSFAELDLYNYVAPCQHPNTEVTGKKDATVEEEGYTGDTVCKDCGETVATGTFIPKLDPPATQEPTTTPPATVEPAPTGDAMVVAVALAVLALGAVVVSKKRRITE